MWVSEPRGRIASSQCCLVLFDTESWSLWTCCVTSSSGTKWQTTRWAVQQTSGETKSSNTEPWFDLLHLLRYLPSCRRGSGQNCIRSKTRSWSRCVSEWTCRELIMRGSSTTLGRPRGAKLKVRTPLAFFFFFLQIEKLEWKLHVRWCYEWRIYECVFHRGVCDFCVRWKREAAEHDVRFPNSGWWLSRPHDGADRVSVRHR